MSHDFVLFAGSANRGLAEAVARHLGVSLGDSAVERFPDGEVSVRLETSVRRKEVFILQPTSPPVDQNLVELLCFADAARRAAADRVTAIVPYFGYSRADKRHGRREPITARMVGDILQAVGVRHVITVDLHAPQIEGFFSIPVDNLTAVGLLADELARGVREDAVVVAPDEGRVRMATRYAGRLGLPVVIVHKRRESGSETRVTGIVGAVEGKRCLVVDDMIATGGTLAATVDALLGAGARPEITVAATHGLLVGEARGKLDRDEVLEVLVTDTVPAGGAGWGKLDVTTVAPLIADAIHQFVIDGSIRTRH